MADFSSLERVLRDRAVEIVNEAAELVKTATTEAAPVGEVNGGNLRDSHNVTPAVDAGRTIFATLNNTSDHAQFVAEGTGAHLIRPVTKKVLHFFVDGTEVFTTLVHHPGTSPNTEWWSEEVIGTRWREALDQVTS